ncbi:MAG TPA: hypothetical protein VND19_06250 [Acetobacteraceae bacterium]|nr:hypothetical protein [Acetobacteraceae bacterium]
MSNASQPDPPLDLLLPRHAYYQLIHTLNATLPPPVADTPDSLLARNDAAIDAVAAMLPTNANEAGFAAQCVAARAQAEDIMRLLRVHADDLTVVMKLNAQYVAMARTSRAAHGHVLRAQAVRHKREANSATLTGDGWTQHIAIRTMQDALRAGLVPAAPAAEPSAPAIAEPPTPVPQPTPATAAQPAPIPAPALPPAAAEPLPRPPDPVAPDPPPPDAASLPARTTATPPHQPRRIAVPAEPDDPPRDLAFDADRYAVIYPRRARDIRRHGGLPPDCSFGPPDDDLVHAIVTGASPALRALDDTHAAAD